MVYITSEVIAKPPALPETRAPDAHFSGIATLARDVSRRFCKRLKCNFQVKGAELIALIGNKDAVGFRFCIAVA